MRFFLLISAFVGGTLFHFYVMNVNYILTNADSFAYLQMAQAMREWSLTGLGTGWFGFLYSVPLLIANLFGNNELLAGQIVNLILFGLSGMLLLLIGRKYLSFYYNLLLLLLFFFSSSLLQYNVNILSENLFIPLFLLLILSIHTFIETEKTFNVLFIGINIGLLYLTRSESFIYIFSACLIFFIMFLNKFINFKELLKYSLYVLVGFCIIASPYVYYLHSFTGEWGLTNKGSSNIRQAMMRGVENMSDEGFEKAVGELTNDKHHLKGGFAGGLMYDKPEDGPSLKELFIESPADTLLRFLENQKKLYTEIIPKMIIGESLTLFTTKESIFFHNVSFFGLIFLPILLFLSGLFSFFTSNQKNFLVILTPFFLVGSLFFTLFFVLERYFIIFLPFIFLVIVYGIQEMGRDIDRLTTAKYLLLGSLLLGNLFLGSWHYASTFDVEKYEVKHIAGARIQDNKNVVGKKDIRIMERFPIVTYYAGARERWLTPYVTDISSLIEYARFNKVDLLVVDTLDFRTYRPVLSFLLNEKGKYQGLRLLKAIEYKGQKVLIYKFIY